jgi:hypothetical protein
MRAERQLAVAPLFHRLFITREPARRAADVAAALARTPIDT